MIKFHTISDVVLDKTKNDLKDVISGYEPLDTYFRTNKSTPASKLQSKLFLDNEILAITEGFKVEVELTDVPKFPLSVDPFIFKGLDSEIISGLSVEKFYAALLTISKPMFYSFLSNNILCTPEEAKQMYSCHPTDQNWNDLVALYSIALEQYLPKEVPNIKLKKDEAEVDLDSDELDGLAPDIIRSLLPNINLSALISGVPMSYPKDKKTFIDLLVITLHCCMNGPVGVNRVTTFPIIDLKTSIKAFCFRFGNDSLTTSTWRRHCLFVSQNLNMEDDAIRNCNQYRIHNGKLWPHWDTK